MKNQLQKKLPALVVTMMFCFCVANAQIIVQFNIDMVGQTIAAGGLHVAGQFAKDHSTSILQDWAPGAAGSQLTLLSGSYYTLQVSFPSASAGDSLQFQFVKDSTWEDANGDASEGNPGDCCLNLFCGVADGGGGYNRLLIIPAHSESFIAAWNQCGALSDSLCFFPLSPITRNGNQLCIAAYSSYQWELNGIVINGATNECYTPTKTGSYAVEVSDPSGCKETSTPYFIITSDHGHIIYTDIIPDHVLNSSGSYPLDIDHDGIVDYNLNLGLYSPNCHGTSNFSTSVTLFEQNSVAYACVSCGSASEINMGDSINSSLLWNTFGSTELLLFSDFWIPNLQHHSCEHHSGGTEWDNKIGFLAIRLYLNGQYYYGWIRIKIIPFVSITIYDYAFNSIPDQFILAGDTGEISTGIFSAEHQDNIFIFPNPAIDKIMLTFSSMEKGTLEIDNLLGQIIFSEEINSAKKEIDVREFPAGIYAVTIKNAKEQFQSKFLKQ